MNEIPGQMTFEPPVRLKTQFSGEFFQSQVAYPVILEGWDRKDHGRVKRAYEMEFNKEERKQLDKYYPTLYRWYFVQGTPRTVEITLHDLDLLKRAANFFGTI